MEQLREKINASRNIKKRTLENYIRNIRLLCNATTGHDFDGDIDFLKDITAVKQELVKKPVGTQKTLLASISVIGGDCGLDADVLTKYRLTLKATKEIYAEGLAGRQKSEREAENWVALKDLEKVLKDLGRRVKDRNIGKKAEDALNKKDFRLLQHFVIASLYLLDNEPRRNIYASMDIIGKGDTQEAGKNYLVIHGRNKKFFVINEQKSKKFRGKTQHISVNSKLNKVLNIWIKYNKSGHLLLDSLGAKMNANQLTKSLNTIFEDTGKKISSSMIRKIWLSDNFGETVSKMEAVAEVMGHSTGTASLHYIKK